MKSLRVFMKSTFHPPQSRWIAMHQKAGKGEDPIRCDKNLLFQGMKKGDLPCMSRSLCLGDRTSVTI